ncbi:MAG: sulfite exporter TauE/SafE family protein, partial [Candidatus Ryanbacteria bacterium]|nr:sulfite exporter TauE/SafE family protein [Candidatus Ryanbacteria bacterium]
SLIFILLGSLFGHGGSALAQYRIWLSRIGGIFEILFGLFMIGVLRLPFLILRLRSGSTLSLSNGLNVEKNIGRIKALAPGNPASSLIFGATFAFGWTPCVGPILGSILTLAAASATVGQGAFLLSVFSLGLAVPFLIIAAGIGSASNYISKLSRYLNVISIIGGLFLIFLGILLFTNKLGVWIAYFYQWFDFINYERLLDYL